MNHAAKEHKYLQSRPQTSMTVFWVKPSPGISMFLKFPGHVYTINNRICQLLAKILFQRENSTPQLQGYRLSGLQAFWSLLVIPLRSTLNKHPAIETPFSLADTEETCLDWTSCPVCSVVTLCRSKAMLLAMLDNQAAQMLSLSLSSIQTPSNSGYHFGSRIEGILT